jgi:hypothetical protein
MKKGVIKRGDRFRLNRSASGMVLRNGKEVSIPIPEGTVIEIVGGPFHGTQLMDVRCNDEMVLMFRADLERGSRANTNSAILDRPIENGRHWHRRSTTKGVRKFEGGSQFARLT